MPGQHAPYYVKKRKNKYVVVNKDGEVKGTHDTRQEALDQQAALYVNVPGAKEEADKGHKKKKSNRNLAAQARELLEACKAEADRAGDDGNFNREAAMRYRRAQSLLTSAVEALDFDMDPSDPATGMESTDVHTDPPGQEFPPEAYYSSVPCPKCSLEWQPSSFRCAGCDTDFGDLPEPLQDKMRFHATRGR